MHGEGAEVKDGRKTLEDGRHLYFIGFPEHSTNSTFPVPQACVHSFCLGVWAVSLAPIEILYVTSLWFVI